MTVAYEKPPRVDRPPAAILTTGKLRPECRGDGRMLLASQWERAKEGQGVHVSERTGFGWCDFAVGGAVLNLPGQMRR